MMNRMLVLLVAFICTHLSIKEGFANTETGPYCPPVQFYAGIAGGIERMNGRRSEGLTETVGGVLTSTSYTSSYRMLENNAYVSFLGGFLWKFPPLPILMGPEIYFGRGNTRSTITDISHPDPRTGDNRLYSTDFARKFFYGGLIRIGHLICNEYLVSFSIGIDRCQFLTKRYFALDPAFRATIVDRSSGLNGVLFGLGLEKLFRNFIVGVDFKLIQYRRQLSVDSVLITNAPANSDFSVRPVIYSAGVRLAYKF